MQSGASEDPQVRRRFSGSHVKHLATGPLFSYSSLSDALEQTERVAALRCRVEESTLPFDDLFRGTESGPGAAPPVGTALDAETACDP